MPKIVPYDEKKIGLPCSLVYESQAKLIKEMAAEGNEEDRCSQSAIVQEAMNDYITKYRESERG